MVVSVGDSYRISELCELVLAAIASPSSYPCQSVGQWVSQSVIDSFRFGDGYRISELCELVFGVLVLFSIIFRCFRITVKLERKNTNTFPMKS